jgi:glycosyltransferase involved in cell wall biosynthesis
VRVLFVLEYFPPHVGGVETLFALLAAGLRRRGLDVTVLTLALPGAPGREVMDGVEVVRLRAPRRLRRYAFTALALPAVWREARRADIVHTTTYNAALPAWLGGVLRRRPVVCTVHEVFGSQWCDLPGVRRLSGYGFRAFEWGLLRLPFAHVIADSEFTRQRLVRAGVPAGRTRTVHPTLDHAFWDARRHTARPLRRELGLPEHAFVYLYFGRPGVSKGVEYLLQAAASVRRRLEGSHLVMLLADDPPHRHAHIMSERDRLGLGGHVTVLGPVSRDELPGYLLAADCVAVPSLSEGFGYAALEAATLGRRVVATRGHAVEEVVGQAARLVPPRDAEALAEAIVASAAPGPGPPAPPRYEAETHVSAVLEVYESVLARRRSSVAGRADTVA